MSPRPQGFVAERASLRYDLDMAILALRETYGEIAPAVRLTGTYHNLLRRWVDV